jgi:hypothetical protein
MEQHYSKASIGLKNNLHSTREKTEGTKTSAVEMARVLPKCLNLLSSKFER